MNVCVSALPSTCYVMIMLSLGILTQEVSFGELYFKLTNDFLSAKNKTIACALPANFYSPQEHKMTDFGLL